MTLRAMPLRRITDRLSKKGLLAADVPAGTVDGGAVRDVVADSRDVNHGALFCAIPGSVENGHRYLREAARSGAIAALVEQPVAGLPIPQIRVTEGRPAAAVAAAVFFDEPWNEITLIGATGTNGKTTTVFLLRHLLEMESPAGSLGTLGVVGSDGRVIEGTTRLTTPGVVDVARWLRHLADSGVTSVAMEVSSHALHQGRIGEARLAAAVMLNLSRDHLDYHQTPEAYRDAKLGIVDLCLPNGVLVVNADEPAWGDIRANDRRTIRFGSAEPSNVRAKDMRAAPGGMRFTLCIGDDALPVTLPLLGEYNISNALAAAATLHGLGWPANRIAAGLERLPQVPGRLQRVTGPAGAPTVLIDYAHTPDALGRVLATLRPLTRGRLFVVFGAGGDRDQGKRAEMGRAAGRGADVCIVTSDNPRTEDPERIVHDITSGMRVGEPVRILDRRAAIRHALAEADEQDTVLLAGKGHETYQEIGTRRFPFAEAEIVAEIWRTQGGFQ